MDKIQIVKIQNFLSNLFYKKKRSKNFLTKNFFSYDAIDSLSILKFFMQIEKKYKIRLNDKEIFEKRINTIKKLSYLIKKMSLKKD